MKMKHKPCHRQKGHRLIVADPPWKFDDALPGAGRGAVKHYPCMTLRQLKAFTMPAAAPDSLLFLWRVAAMVEEAAELARAWGFVPKAELVWYKVHPCKRCEGRGWRPGNLRPAVLREIAALREAERRDNWLRVGSVAHRLGEALKVAPDRRTASTPPLDGADRMWCKRCEGRGWLPAFGMGRYARFNHEVCMIAARGRYIVQDHSIRSVVEAPIGRHSEKPAEFYDIAARLAFGAGAALPLSGPALLRGGAAEVFARRRRPGWCCFGNEVGARP